MTIYQCVEMGGNVDENRPLLKTGLFAVELASESTIETFKSAAEALSAGERAPNRRAGLKLHPLPGVGRAS